MPECVATSFRSIASFVQLAFALTTLLVLSAGSGLARDIHQELIDQSRLTLVSKSHELHVCMNSDYFAISYRNPKTGKLEGIDVDIAHELAASLNAKLDIVESSFSTFAADLLTNKCDIGMFGLAQSLSRAQAVEFSKPYIVTGIYAVARKDNPKVRTWADLDKPSVTIAVKMGSVAEPIIRSHMKNASIAVVQPPASAEQEVGAGRADALAIDYAIATQITATNDWATIIAPDHPVVQIPFAYAVAPGDQIWLNYINLFIETIKRDGRLKAIGDRHNLGPILNLSAN